MQRLPGFFRSSATASLSVRALATRAPGPDDKKFEFVRPFKLHKLTTGPDNSAYSNKAELLSFLRTMVYYRRLEVVADTLYKARDIRGFCHLYDGQEAVVTGMKAAMKLGTDSVIAAYRDHCHQIAMGDTGGRVLAELMARRGGSTHGKGGSMHLYFPKNGFYGGNGIVGAQVPIGAGLAFAHKFKKDGGVSMAFFGDGAANQGQIYEAANMAMLWKLPLIFVCENNKYGMGTAIERASASTDFYTRGDYVPGIWVDGLDVLASKAGFAYALEHCRSGKGPIFLEANTYRYHGHSMSDPGISYRRREEVEDIKSNRDCIDLVRARLLKSGWATEADLKAVDKEAKALVEKDLEYARASPFPPVEDLYADVYADAPPPFLRAVEYPKSLTAAGSS